MNEVKLSNILKDKSAKYLGTNLLYASIGILIATVLFVVFHPVTLLPYLAGLGMGLIFGVNLVAFLLKWEKEQKGD